ncbi:septum formation initiator [Hyunsoonleella flava]|uniref:Septum formation initiator n=1 Tax=Hyunsoonleella flava TaxID=2527939 RepID=A0A4Q9FDU9_9FLAO|nr:septum formation initiator family protein [Hyunsoonleella flava]TBN03648.1 septum formation initiator [Hyunsoonleella flava]
MKKFNLNHRFLKPFKNIYILGLVIFAIWMIFLDDNSWFIHNELNTEIKNLKAEKEYYRKGKEKDDKEFKKLSSEQGLEKFAREEYYMKRENEEIFIIEYEDSLKTKDNE